MVHSKRGDRVEAEAAALEAARHPGVVELVGVAEGTLRTRMVEGRVLSEVGPLLPEEVAGLASALATTLADLHEIGVVHGGVEASHVIVAEDGHPVLCSLGRGGQPADDVAALGRLITSLTTGPAPLQPLRRRLQEGTGRRRLGPMLAPPAGATLTEVAEQATAADPAQRPSARALAAMVNERVPAARLPRPGDGPVLPLRPRPPAPQAPRSHWAPVPGGGLAVLGGGVALVVAVTAWALWPAAPSSQPTPPALDAGSEKTTTTTVPVTTAPSPVATRVWPPEPVGFDGVFAFGGARYAVGRPGDAVVIGDWSCTGRPTPVLLRPSTGEVVSFDAWPDQGQEVAARPVGRVEGATGLRVERRDDDGCEQVVATRGEGQVVPLDPANRGDAR